MVLGYTFIKADGYPLGNIQPTLEAAEHVARFEPSGWFYIVEQDDASKAVFLRRTFRKGEP